MKKGNSNRVNMINSLITYCDNRTAVTIVILQFALKLADVKAKMVLINGLNQLAMGARNGVTLDTNLIRAAMTQLAFKCANATFAYANEVQDTVLRAKVKLTMTDYTSKKKEDVDDLCQEVHDSANAHAADVVNYGIVATDISDLQVAINLHRTHSQNPREAQITEGQAIKQADILIRELIDDLLIGQLDAMANTLRFDNNEFWRGYFQARVIINLGSTSTKVRGTVKTVDDVPLVGVMFRIMQTGTETEVARVFTLVKGVFSANNLPSGDFDLEWSFAGYDTVKQVGVHLSPGKEVKRSVVMEVMDNIVVEEGGVAVNEIDNVPIPAGINDDSIIKVEAFGSQMRIFASDTVNGDITGTGAMYVNLGTPLEMKWDLLVAQIGLNVANSFLNIKNVGGSSGAWKVMFAID